jgi:aspartate-semialdehyde dehydrogenase
MTTPKNKNGFRLGIINPLTLVGNEIKSILRERAFPYARLALLDSAGQTAGALTDVGDEPAVVSAASDIELEDLDVVFFCGPPSANQQWLEKAGPDSFIAIDVSQPSSVEDGRLGVATMNLDELDSADRVIVSPHPIAVPIALILRSIGSVAPVEACTTTVVQPASEFDHAGVEELAQQTVAVLNAKSVPKEIFDRQLAFNIYPAMPGHEAFIARQIRSLIDPKTELALFNAQGTTFHGHTFSMFVKTRDEVSAERITDVLRKNPVFAFPEGDQEFGTIDAAGRDEILIAEVRPDANVKRGFWVFAVCDNLRRSSALNAVLIAEKILFDTNTN